jgi:RNA polymerase sigma factor (sigma-70 family)
MTTGQLGSVLGHLRTLAGSPERELSDEQLLQRFQGYRDQSAFAALVRRHGRLVWGVCRNVLHHDHDAEDAFQATFLVLARHARDVRKPESLGSWLHGVAYRVAMRARRAAGRRRLHETKKYPAVHTAGALVSETAWRHLQAALDEAIQALPERLRVPFVLCCLQGRDQRAVAEKLGWKLGTLSCALTRARKELLRRLARQGVSLSATLAAVALSRDAASAAVPALLAPSTVRAAQAFANGAALPAHLAALVNGGLRTMFLSKIKIATGILVATGLVAAACGLGPSFAANEDAKPQEVSVKPQAAQDTDEHKNTIPCTGRVIDPEGRPVARAKVIYARALLARREAQLPQSPPLATSDAEGRFQFPVATTGYQSDEEKQNWLAGTIIATAPGHAPGWVSVHKADMLKNVTVKLVKDVPITGRVVDLQGKPIAGVTVRVRSLAANDTEDLKLWVEALQTKKEIWGEHYPRITLDAILPNLTRSATTDADGKFLLAGFGRERLVGMRFEGQTIETIDVYALTRPGPTLEVLRQKEQPRFGSYVFYGSSFDHAAAPCKPIVGVVRDKDTQKPLASVTIRALIPSAILNQDEERFVHATTDQNGGYRLLGLAKVEGTSVLALPGAGPPYLSSHKEASGSPGLGPATLDFDLKRGIRISGRVTDKVTGAPLVGATVEYFAFIDNLNLRDAPGFRGSAHAGAKTSKDGSFTLVGLPGRGLLASKARDGKESYYLMGDGAEEIPGYERGRFTTDPYICAAPMFNTVVEINPAKNAVLLAQDIGLDPGKTVTGKLVDPAGKPVEGVNIGGVWGVSVHIQNLPTAEFRLPTINPKHPKPYFFMHHDRKLGTAVLFKGDEKTPVNIQLQQCGTLIGRLVDEDGQPRSGVNLTGNIREGQLNITEGWFGFINSTTDKDGRFKIEGVLPGVKVGLSTQKGASITGQLVEEISLKPGEVKDLGDVKSKDTQ